ncbi:hypothetical protein F5Y14DRAFT_466120 [Nemania sp. NC0429]|nr:hypothetical protein F5Y14DRAFT_466120 [Nemania sp. NC0429]
MVTTVHLHILNLKSILKLPGRTQFLSSIIFNPDDAPIEHIDPGVFNVVLLKERLYLRPLAIGEGVSFVTERNWAGGQVRVGTYEGTQAAVTHVYARLEGAYGSYLDALGIESTLPRFVELEQQQENYKFSQCPFNDDGTPAAYPPHLHIIPSADQVSIWKIFNNLGLAEAAIIIKKILPGEFLGKPKDWLLKKAREAADGENIGLQDDWFSDRRFAEQSFGGTNPVTITQPSEALVKEFIDAAIRNGEDEWGKLLQKSRRSLMAQDYSYFRTAISRQWLLASHIPWLLSFKVASDRSLLSFALSQYAMYKSKTGEKDIKIRDAPNNFYVALTGLQEVFYDVAGGMDEGSVLYMVLDPGNTAVSILI